MKKKNMKSNGISVGDLVVRLKDEKQMRVATIRDGKYECNTYECLKVNGMIEMK